MYGAHQVSGLAATCTDGAARWFLGGGGLVPRAMWYPVLCMTPCRAVPRAMWYPVPCVPWATPDTAEVEMARVRARNVALVGEKVTQ